MSVWHAGGEEEAEAAYDEALHAIFALQLERHQHTQPYISKKDGRSKWAMIEMSPMTVSSHLAVTARSRTTHRRALFFATVNKADMCCIEFCKAAHSLA